MAQTVRLLTNDDESMVREILENSTICKVESSQSVKQENDITYLKLNEGYDIETTIGGAK